MDKERWEKIACEMQVHIDRLEEIAKREKLDIVSIALYGEAEAFLTTNAVYIDSDKTQYVAETFKGADSLELIVRPGQKRNVRRANKCKEKRELLVFRN